SSSISVTRFTGSRGTSRLSLASGIPSSVARPRRALQRVHQAPLKARAVAICPCGPGCFLAPLSPRFSNSCSRSCSRPARPNRRWIQCDLSGGLTPPVGRGFGGGTKLPEVGGALAGGGGIKLPEVG